MIIFDEDRPSDSPFVERIWRCHSEGAGPFLSIVQSRCELEVTRLQGKSTLTVRGPETKSTLITGDSDIARPEHVVELFRLLGAGVSGDHVGLPNVQLAVLPGTTHITLVDRADWLVSMITGFLDAPRPE